MNPLISAASVIAAGYLNNKNYLTLRFDKRRSTFVMNINGRKVNGMSINPFDGNGAAGGGGDGFGGNKNFGDESNFHFFKVYLDKINELTDAMNSKIQILAKMVVSDEQDIFFFEGSQEPMRVKFFQYESQYGATSAKYLALFRTEGQERKTNCYFADSQEESGFDPSKCQINQLATVLETIVFAHCLAHTLKPNLCLKVFRNQVFKEHYVQIFENLRMWKIEPGEPMESQVLREITLITDDRLRKLFASRLKQLCPQLQKSFLLYQNCPLFGSTRCVVCGEKMAGNVFRNFEDTGNSETFYVSLFRKTFYKELGRFVTGLE